MDLEEDLAPQPKEKHILVLPRPCCPGGWCWSHQQPVVQMAVGLNAAGKGFCARPS